MAVMTFYSNFSKRENSTKQPTGGTSYNVVFKEGFSVTGGTIKLQASFSTAMNFTAAKYENRYYKVDNVVSITNDIVDIILSLDALATYKDAISMYQCLIQRAPVSSEVAYLADDTISPNLHLAARTQQADYIINPFGDGVCVKVTTIGSTNVQCYYMSTTGLSHFLTSTELANAFSDLSNFIKSIEIVPIPLSSVTALGVTSTDRVMLGNKYILVDCYAITSAGLVLTETKTIDTTDVLFLYSDARKLQSDYTKWIVTVNNTDFEVPAELNTSSSINIKLQLDLITLDALIIVSVGPKIIGATQTTVGIPYAYNSSDPFIKNLVSAMVASGGNIAIGAVKAFNDNIHAVRGVTPPGGSLSAINFPIVRAVLYEHESTGKSPSTNGYPYYKVNFINAINTNGFYRFENPSIDIGDVPSVRNEINSFLSRGFYYE